MQKERKVIPFGKDGMCRHIETGSKQFSAVKAQNMLKEMSLGKTVVADVEQNRLEEQRPKKKKVYIIYIYIPSRKLQ